MTALCPTCGSLAESPSLMFKGSWPILRRGMSAHEAVAEAKPLLGTLVAAQHARLTGPARWWVADNRVWVVAPAEHTAKRRGRAGRGAVASRLDEVRRLRTVENLTDAQIAAHLGGCTEAGVESARRRRRIHARRQRAA